MVAHGDTVTTGRCGLRPVVHTNSGNRTRHRFPRGQWLAAALPLVKMVGLAQADTTPQADAWRLEPVTVSGTRQPDDAPRATRFGDPGRSPALIEVIDDQQIRALQPDRLEVLLPYLTGLQIGTSSAGLGSAFMARGFSQGTGLYVNGHQDIQRLYVREFATVERVEVLHGHSAVLFGQAPPGASINYITKAPLAESHVRSSLSVDSAGAGRGEVDINGLAGDGGGLRYRLVGATQGGPTWQNNVDSDRQTVFGAFGWHYGRDSSLRVETESQHNQRNFSFGTAYVNGHFLFDRSWVGDAATADRRYDRQALYWNYAVSDSLSVHPILNQARARRTEQLVGFWSTLTDSSLSGYYTRYRDDFAQTNARAEADVRFELANLGHRLLTGVEQNRQRIDFVGAQNSEGFEIDMDRPTFPDVSTLPTTPRFNRERQLEQAVFVQDAVQVGRANQLTLGLRQSRYQVDVDAGSGLVRRADLHRASHHFGGLLYPTENTNVYVQYNESFLPNRGLDRNNAYLPPREARQVELGGRWRSAGGEARLHLALYRLAQTNLTARDTQAPGVLKPIGSVRTQGVEFSAEVMPMRACVWSRQPPGLIHATRPRFLRHKAIGRRGLHQDWAR